MVGTGKIRFWLPMFWQVKIKPQLVTMKSRIVRLLQTKSASDFDGRKVHHEKEHLIMYHELCHYLQLSVISYNFHIWSLNKLFSYIPSGHLYAVFIKNAFHDFPCYSTENVFSYSNTLRGGSRTVAASKIGRFLIMVNSRKPLAITTKRSILDVAAVLDPPLHTPDFQM